jgi:hypothetical protein
MDSPPVRHVTTTPALPCHVCGTLTTTACIEPREKDRWTLFPVCDKHGSGATP